MTISNKNLWLIIAATLIGIGAWLALSQIAWASQWQFTPTSHTIVTGTERPVTSATAAGANAGVNAGSWKGTLADDNIHWVVGSTTGGVNMQLNIDDVALNNANKMMIQTEIDLDATAPQLLVQICDWTSSISVDHAADAQCTGGGWRTLNSRNAAGAYVAITTTSGIAFQWHVHNGYFSTGATGGSAIDTPLANFISPSPDKRVKIRYFSTTNTTSNVSIDYLRIYTTIDSIYAASGFEKLAGGAVTGHYSVTNPIANTATAIISRTTDNGNQKLTVGAQAAVANDYYYVFKDIRLLPSFNTLLVRAETNCASNSGTLLPRVYNHDSSQWENLTSAAIPCSTTDAAREWSIGNLTDYISDTNEVWVRFTNSNVNQASATDMIYIMVGTTNTDQALCEVTFGGGTATDCAATRDIDVTGTLNLFTLPTEDESTNMGSGEANSFYGLDTANNSTVEEAAAGNIEISAQINSNTQIVGHHYASRYSGCGQVGNACTAPNHTVQIGLRNYSGVSSVTGGWTQVGAASNTGYTYTDSMTTLTAPLYGWLTNPDDHIDTFNSRVNFRLRTTTGGNPAANVTTVWDFMMHSMMWVESDVPTRRNQFVPTSQTLVTGNDVPANSATAAAANGVNTGSWKGTLANDNYHWIIEGNSSGIDMQLNLDGVELHNANKIVVNTEVRISTSDPQIKFQICDWTSSVSVDHAADAQCTGGGWRTMNSKNVNNADVNFSGTTAREIQWHLYNGYFSTGVGGGTAIDTPLTNFVSDDTDRRLKIRYYSTVNSSATVAVDYLRVTTLIDPVYDPSAFTKLSGGAVAGVYVNTQHIGNTSNNAFVTGDSVRIGVSGTISESPDFYFSFSDIRTYPGANTIYVKHGASCSVASTQSYNVWIYNHNTTGWEQLNNAAIICGTTDLVHSFAKNNVNLSHYVSDGEARIRYSGVNLNTVQLRINSLLIMVGTVNSDTSLCEVSFGAGDHLDCSATRDVDERTHLTGANMFINPAVQKSSNMGTGAAFSYYAFDGVHAADTNKVAASNITFSDIQAPTGGSIATIHMASRAYSGANAGGAPNIVVTAGFRNYAGLNNATGGWTAFGATTAAPSNVLTDSISTSTGALYGMLQSPDTYVNNNNEINLRLRTSTSGNPANDSGIGWDFAMVGISWIEPQLEDLPDPEGPFIFGQVLQDNMWEPLEGIRTVYLSVNGGTRQTASTNVDGEFNIQLISDPVDGDIITLWLNSADGTMGTLVLEYGASEGYFGCSTYPDCEVVIIADHVSLYSADEIKDEEYYLTSVITTTDLSLCNASSGTGCSHPDIGFSESSGLLSITAPNFFVMEDTRLSATLVESHNSNIKGDGIISTTAWEFNGLGEFGGNYGIWELGNLVITGDMTMESGWDWSLEVEGVDLFGHLNMGSAQVTITGYLQLHDEYNPTFEPGNSRVAFYNDVSMAIPALTYYDLSFYSLADSVTYTIGAGNLVVNRDLNFATSNSNFTINAATNNPNIDVNRNLQIALNTNLIAPSSGSFNVGGSWTNNGSFTHNGGTVTMDGASSHSITGNVSGINGFNNLAFSGSGSYTLPSADIAVNANLTIANGATVIKSAAHNIVFSGNTEQVVTDNNTTKQDLGAIKIEGNSGINWATQSPDLGFGGVVWSPELELYVATVSASNTIQISEDGETWQQIFDDSITNGRGGVAWSPKLGIFVMTYNVGPTFIRTSTNGVNWNAIPHQPGHQWGRVRWFSDLDLFIAFGNTQINKIMTSPDGLNWTIRTAPANANWIDADWSPELGLLVGIASSGTGDRFMTSSDGINWVSHAPPTTTAWGAIKWVPEMLMFVANSTVFTTSTDGFNWTTPVTPSAGLSAMLGTGTYSPEMRKLVSLGALPFGTLVTSLDASTWAVSSMPSANAWNTIFWNPDLEHFLALASSGTNRVAVGRVENTRVQLGSSIKVTSVDIGNWQSIHLGANTLTLTGNGASVLTGSGGLFADTGTVEFQSTNTTGTVIPNMPYHNVSLNRAGNTFTTATDLYIKNNLNIIAGTLDLNTNDDRVEVKGSIINSDSLLASNVTPLPIYNIFTNNGTFTHNNGEVILKPVVSGSTVTINGASNVTFYDLTSTKPATIVEFAVGRNYTIAGELEVVSQSGRPSWIRSTTLGEQFFVTLNGTLNLNYVNIRDAGCVGGINFTGLTNIVNQGNNGVCWGLVTDDSLANAPTDGPSGGAGVGGGGQGGGGSADEQSTSWTSPGTAVNDASIGTRSWNNPGNSMAAGGGSASVELSGTSNYLKVTNFGFNVPSNAEIEGVTVRVVASGNSTENQVRLVINNSVVGDNKSTGAVVTGTKTYGSSSDLWGNELTPEIINSSDFGYALSVVVPGAPESGGYVDHITIQIHYTIADEESGPGGGGGVGGEGNTGATSPGTISNVSFGAVSWSNASNAQSSNNVYATAPRGISDYLTATNFGFSIPNDAEITGVVVQIEGRSSHGGVSGVNANNLRLVKNGSVTGNSLIAGVSFPTVDTIRSVGSAGNLWGATLTPSDVNASNFGVALSTDAYSFNEPQDAVIAYIDHITITVYYEAGNAPGGGGGGSP